MALQPNSPTTPRESISDESLQLAPFIDRLWCRAYRIEGEEKDDVKTNGEADPQTGTVLDATTTTEQMTVNDVDATQTSAAVDESHADSAQPSELPAKGRACVYNNVLPLNACIGLGLGIHICIFGRLNL